jgi:hypothetical protein
MTKLTRNKKDNCKFKILGVKQSLTEVGAIVQKKDAERAFFCTIKHLQKMDLSKYFDKKDIAFIKNISVEVSSKLAQNF